LVKIIVNPGNFNIDTHDGVSIRDAILNAGIEIYSPCGGMGICGKCGAKILSGKINGDVDEDGYFLTCSSIPLSDCEIEISSIPDDTKAETSIAVGDVLLKSDSSLGLAVDLGTTNIICALIDLDTKQVLETFSFRNPQTKYGDDVVSRISFAAEKDGLEILKRAVLETIDDVINGIFRELPQHRKRLTEIVFSGNSTMNHLLLGISPSSLGQAPYEPAFKYIDSGEISDRLNMWFDDVDVTVLPNIAGFVGGDTVAGIIATGIYKSEKLRLFIDIGTNGEIVVGNKNRMLATSAAAGPAFEGGRIECGMRAGPGAINHVSIDNGKASFTTIDGIEPNGICGSGLFEAVGSMLRAGLLDSSGKFTSTVEEKRFYLTEERGGVGIYISEKDISELQLAKAAIRAAVELLLSEYRIDLDDVDEIIVAGAFGFNLRPDDIRAIGLLPDFDYGKLRLAGNTSLKGALMVLTDDEARAEMVKISSNVEFIELAGKSGFREKFVEALTFNT